MKTYLFCYLCFFSTLSLYHFWYTVKMALLVEIASHVTRTWRLCGNVPKLTFRLESPLNHERHEAPSLDKG